MDSFQPIAEGGVIEVCPKRGGDTLPGRDSDSGPTIARQGTVKADKGPVPNPGHARPNIARPEPVRVPHVIRKSGCRYGRPVVPRDTSAGHHSIHLLLQLPQKGPMPDKEVRAFTPQKRQEKRRQLAAQCPLPQPSKRKKRKQAYLHEPPQYSRYE